MPPFYKAPTAPKIRWNGEVISIQPRIRLTRSFDERSHSYLGYALRLRGTVAGETREFSLGVGPGAQAKHAFSVGDRVSGEAMPVADAQLEPVEFYKASALALGERAASPPSSGPPWRGIPLPLETYRRRGHRRLDPRTYEAKCRGCHWGLLDAGRDHPG